MKRLKVSIINLLIGFAFLMVNEAMEYNAYYDQGSAHLDSGHIDFVNAANNKSSQNPALHVLRFAQIPPQFIVGKLFAPELRMPHPQFCLQDQLPSRASPVLPLKPVKA